MISTSQGCWGANAAARAEALWELHRACPARFHCNPQNKIVSGRVGRARRRADVISRSRTGGRRDKWVQDQWSMQAGTEPGPVLCKVYDWCSIHVVCWTHTLMSRDWNQPSSPPPLLPPLPVIVLYSPPPRPGVLNQEPLQNLMQNIVCVWTYIFLSKEMLDFCPEKLLNKPGSERWASIRCSVRLCQLDLSGPQSYGFKRKKQKTASSFVSEMCIGAPPACSFSFLKVN